METPWFVAYCLPCRRYVAVQEHPSSHAAGAPVIVGTCGHLVLWVARTLDEAETISNFYQTMTDYERVIGESDGADAPKEPKPARKPQ